QARLQNLPLGELIQIPISLFEAGYSKEQELEADRDGTALAVMAGYSPAGATPLFQTLPPPHRADISKTKNPDEELSRVAIQTIEGYFRSHPAPEDREHQIRSLIASEKWPQPKEKPLKFHLAEPKPEVAKQQ